MSGRVFTADYNRSQAKRKVWFPLILAGAMGAIGLTTGVPVVAFFGAMFVFISLRNWPLVRNERPALVLSANGAEIDGLGRIPWREIAGVESGKVRVKSLTLPALDLSFRRPLVDILELTDSTRLRPWEVRVFRLRGDGKIRLDLLKIAETPDDIQAAFRYFISGQD